VSRYGQLFDEASRIRRQLEDLLSGRLTGNYTPADARRIVREPNPLVEQVDQLALDLERLEQEMHGA